MTLSACWIKQSSAMVLMELRHLSSREIASR